MSIRSELYRVSRKLFFPAFAIVLILIATITYSSKPAEDIPISGENITSYSSDALDVEIHYPSEWVPKIEWVDTTTWDGFINGQIDPVECIAIFPYWHTAENFDDMICIIYFRPFGEHGPEGDSGSHIILRSCEDGEYIAWCQLTCKMNYDFSSEEWETFQLIENGILQNQITLQSDK